MELMNYPDHIDNIEEMHYIAQVTDEWATKLEKDVQELNDNIMVLTSDEEGCKRREAILGIVPLDTDTLDERRYRILLRWYDTYPYTENDLTERLTRLCPDGEFNLTVDYDQLTVDVKLGLTNKKNFAALKELLEELIPLHVYITTELLYNRWSTFASKTWAQMASKTWKQAKEDPA